MFRERWKVSVDWGPNLPAERCGREKIEVKRMVVSQGVKSRCSRQIIQ